MISVFSFDVEEWFHGVPDFSASDRAASERTLEAEFDFIAEELASAGVGATFFVLDEVARFYPQIIRQIVEAGWEVASHGSGHACLYESNPDEFREGLKRSVGAIEDSGGAKVLGYRAPMWSLGPWTEWAVEVMLEQGIRYDSSVYPLSKHDPKKPFVLSSAGGEILEVPPMPIRLGPILCPLATGMYQRCFPWALYRPLLRHEAERAWYLHPYLHPWEISVEDRDFGGLTLGKRLYYNLGRRALRTKFGRLLREFDFKSVAQEMGRIRAMATATLRLDEVACYRAAYFSSGDHGE